MLGGFDILANKNYLQWMEMTSKKIPYEFIDKLEKLEKALQKLEFMLSKGVDKDRAYIDSSIQRFEFVFELFWKSLKAFLEYEGKAAAFPRQIFEEAYKGKLIDDEKIWLQMMKDRNQITYTYDESLADDIYNHIKTYIPTLKMTFTKLKSLEKDLDKNK